MDAHLVQYTKVTDERSKMQRLDKQHCLARRKDVACEADFDHVLETHVNTKLLAWLGQTTQVYELWKKKEVMDKNIEMH